MVLEGNRGFAAAVNAGVAASSSEYVALLNNDMELDPAGWPSSSPPWTPTRAPARRRASCGCCASRGVLDGAGDLVTWYGATWRRGHGEPDRGQYDAPGVVASPCAGAALYRRRALEAGRRLRRALLRLPRGRRLGAPRPARGLAVPVGAVRGRVPPRRRDEPPHGRPRDRADRPQHARAGAQVVPGGAAARLVAADPRLPGATRSRARSGGARGARYCAGGEPRSATCRAPCERAARSAPAPATRARSTR